MTPELGESIFNSAKEQLLADYLRNELPFEMSKRSYMRIQEMEEEDVDSLDWMNGKGFICLDKLGEEIVVSHDFYTTKIDSYVDEDFSRMRLYILYGVDGLDIDSYDLSVDHYLWSSGKVADHQEFAMRAIKRHLDDRVISCITNKNGEQKYYVAAQLDCSDEKFHRGYSILYAVEDRFDRDDSKKIGTKLKSMGRKVKEYFSSSNLAEK